MGTPNLYRGGNSGVSLFRTENPAKYLSQLGSQVDAYQAKAEQQDITKETAGFLANNPGATQRDMRNFNQALQGYGQATLDANTTNIDNRFKQTGAEQAAAEAQVAQAKLLGDYQSKMGIEMLKSKNKNQQVQDLIAGKKAIEQMGIDADKYKKRGYKPTVGGLDALANLDQAFKLSPTLSELYGDKTDSAIPDITGWIGTQNNLTNKQLIETLMNVEQNNANILDFLGDDPDPSKGELNKSIQNIR